MFPLVNSAVPSIQWPAITSGVASELMSLQFQLLQSGSMPAEQRLAKQHQQLSLLINHAYQTSPFYQQYYQKYSYRPPAQLSADNWHKIPIISRADIQAAGDSIHSTNVPAEHVAGGELTTSGSTGLPVTVKTTQVSQFIGLALGLREQLWHQRDLTKKLCVIKHFDESTMPPTRPSTKPPTGAVHSQWNIATGLLYITGKSAGLPISASIAEQISWLHQQQPDYLLTYPSNLVALINYSEKTATPLPPLLGVSTLGEVVTNDVRALCREKLGITLTDIYSCQEMGYLASQCPVHEHYHVQSENVLLEVLNDAGQPCQVGETGRVVISALHNFATPLIRYDIGDYAQVGSNSSTNGGEPCSCGCTLPVLSQIHGRARNMVSYPDGNTRWPFVGSSQYRDIANIKQFQFVQHSINHIEVRLVTEKPLSTEQEQQLTQIIHTALMHPFPLTFSYHAKLERSKGGKFEDFISQIKTQGSA